MPSDSTRRAAFLSPGTPLSNAEMPLEYMIRVMNDGTADVARRDRMARAAVPYLHARLKPTTPTPPPEPGLDLSLLTDEELDQLTRIHERLAERIKGAPPGPT